MHDQVPTMRLPQCRESTPRWRASGVSLNPGTADWCKPPDQGHEQHLHRHPRPVTPRQLWGSPADRPRCQRSIRGHHRAPLL
jgi:hypothetical protein